MKKSVLLSLIVLLGSMSPEFVEAQSQPVGSLRASSSNSTSATPVRAGSRSATSRNQFGDPTVSAPSRRFGGSDNELSRVVLNSSLQYRWGILTDEEYNALNPEGQNLFDQANLMADKVNYAEAQELLAAAASENPDHVGIQFLLLKTARQAAETTYSDESLRNYEMAAEALRRLTSNSSLTPEERLRAGRESERMREGIDNLRQRDQRRLEDGFKFVARLNSEKVAQFEKTLDIEDEAFPFVTIDEILNAKPPVEAAGPAVAQEEIWTYLSAPGIQLPQPPPIDGGQGGVFGTGIGQGFGGFQGLQSGPGAGGFDAGAFGVADPADPAGFGANQGGFGGQQGGFGANQGGFGGQGGDPFGNTGGFGGGPGAGGGFGAAPTAGGFGGGGGATRGK